MPCFRKPPLSAALLFAAALLFLGKNPVRAAEPAPDEPPRPEAAPAAAAPAAEQSWKAFDRSDDDADDDADNDYYAALLPPRPSLSQKA